MAVLERVDERLLQLNFVDLGTRLHWDYLGISYMS